MKTSDSHSWVIHSLPKRKLEKMSVWGILLVSKMYCPVLRCHQKSESVRGRAVARIKITAMTTKTSGRRLDRSTFISPRPDWSGFFDFQVSLVHRAKAPV